MDEATNPTVIALHEIRDLLLLIAEPAIAKRDHKLRTELRKIVGKSAVAAKSVLLMDGNHSQGAIHEKTGMHRGNLSTLVRRLNDAKLLVGDVKQPKLVIIVPSDFFEGEQEA